MSYKLQDNYIKECYSCHKAKYDASVNPKHSTIGFGTTCEQCHNTTVWKPSTWSHSSPPASWPLTGFHTTLTCTNCHPNSQQLASRDCYSCHKAKYDASTNPKHSAAKIGTVCENCHNTSAWTPGKFNHATDAKGAISSRWQARSAITVIQIIVTIRSVLQNA